MVKAKLEHTKGVIRNRKSKKSYGYGAYRHFQHYFISIVVVRSSGGGRFIT
jgi:hypothetical protein